MKMLQNSLLTLFCRFSNRALQLGPIMGCISMIKQEFCKFGPLRRMGAGPLHGWLHGLLVGAEISPQRAFSRVLAINNTWAGCASGRNEMPPAIDWPMDTRNVGCADFWRIKVRFLLFSPVMAVPHRDSQVVSDYTELRSRQHIWLPNPAPFLTPLHHSNHTVACAEGSVGLYTRTSLPHRQLFETPQW